MVFIVHPYSIDSRTLLHGKRKRSSLSNAKWMAHFVWANLLWHLCLFDGSHRRIICLSFKHVIHSFERYRRFFFSFPHDFGRSFERRVQGRVGFIHDSSHGGDTRMYFLCPSVRRHAIEFLLPVCRDNVSDHLCVISCIVRHHVARTITCKQIAGGRRFV